MFNKLCLLKVITTPDDIFVKTYKYADENAVLAAYIAICDFMVKNDFKPELLHDALDEAIELGNQSHETKKDI